MAAKPGATEFQGALYEFTDTFATLNDSSELSRSQRVAEGAMPELVRVSGCDNPQRRGDVVFVHGLNGDPRDYWGAAGSYWPAWFGVDLPYVGVWSLGYENAAFKSRWLSFLSRTGSRGFAMPLWERSKSVLLKLELADIGERPLVFITHSMGGLLVKQLLRTASDSSDPRWKAVLERTRGVCFIATPHIGSDLAKWGTYFRTLLGTNVSMDELRPHEPLLLSLQEWYRNYVTRQGVDIKTLSFYETKPLVGDIPVVAKGDADPGIPQAGLHPLDDDHRTICRPQSAKSEIHLKVIKFVKLCVDNLHDNIDLLTSNSEGHQAGIATNSSGNYFSRLAFRAVIDDPHKLLQERVGPHSVRDFIGAGGSGLVFRTFHVGTGRPFCIKLLYPIDEQNKAILNSISRGIRALNSFNHENIIKIHGINSIKFHDCSTTAIEMEHIEGTHLASWSLRLNGRDDAFPKRFKMAFTLANAL